METKTAPINMRVKPSVRNLIDAAANMQSMERTAFIQAVMIRESENVLLDKRFYHLEETEFTAFKQAIDEPVGSIDKLKTLLSKNSPWE